MIDQESLEKASSYINNQLLSRGLLRDGLPIDFADHVSGDNGTSSKNMARIIGLVNDLILKRDVSEEGFLFFISAVPDPTVASQCTLWEGHRGMGSPY